MPVSHRRRDPQRQGFVVVLICVMMVVLLGLVAFSVDIGYVVLARCEAQRTADSAALAAAWEYLERGLRQDEAPFDEVMAAVQQEAANYASKNRVCTKPTLLAPNPDNSDDGDVVVGTIDDFSDRSAPLYTDNPDTYNAVRVRVRRAVGQNGEVPLFFGRIWGYDSAPVTATATAAVVSRVSGFRTPGSGTYLPILPLTLHVDAWQELLDGTNEDNWAWNEESGAVESGSDSQLEVKLYPETTGAPGNSGTVNIGTETNSASNLGRQIREGISAADLEYHGGSLDLEGGSFTLTGDPGLSASIKDDLAAIRGQPRVIPLYDVVGEQGNNAVFTIVKWVGVRIMEVKLTGNDKRIIVQPAQVVTGGVINGTTEETSEHVYSRPYLVR